MWRDVRGRSWSMWPWVVSMLLATPAAAQSGAGDGVAGPSESPQEEDAIPRSSVEDEGPADAASDATEGEEDGEEAGSPARSEAGANASEPLAPSPSPSRVRPFEETASAMSGPSSESPASATEPEEEEEGDEGEEEKAPLVWHTSLFSRYELRDGYTEIGRTRSVHPFAFDGDYVAYRARFGFETRPLRLNDELRVLVRFAPQSTGYWNVGGDTLSDAGLDLHEGYLQILGEDWSLRSGRFEMVYGDHFVVGNVGWHWTSRTFDAVRFRKSLGVEGAWFDLFVSLLDEGRAGGLDEATLQDTWFGGFYGSFGPLVRKGLALDGYLLFQYRPQWAPDPAAPDDDRFPELRMTLGARSKHEIGDFDYRTEVGLQFGSTGPGSLGGDARTILAYQGDLEVGYSFGPVRLGIEGFYASGDDPDTADTVEGWNMLYPTAHKWLGLMDIVFVRTNVYGGVFHFKAKVNEALSLFLDAHYFARPRDGNDSGVMRQAGVMGYEVDVGGKYVLAPGLHTRLGYSVYLPRQSYYGLSDPAHFFEFELMFQH